MSLVIRFKPTVCWIMVLFCTCTVQALSQNSTPELTSIIAIVDPTEINSRGDISPGVDLSRVPFLNVQKMRAKLENLLGTPIRPDLLQQVQTLIVEYYRGAGHPFLDVGFPQQDVTNGVLNVVVSEFHLGDISVEGNSWFSERFIRNRSGLKAGQIIDNTALTKRLTTLNAGPFLQVTPEFKPGDVAATTNVVLRAEDHFPVRLTAGYDNTGGPTTGWNRWNLGATWGNAFWQGQTLSYQFGSSDNFWTKRPSEAGRTVDPNFLTHSGTWQIPLPWGDSITFSGSYTRQSPNLGPDLGSIGLTENAGFLYTAPLNEPALAGYTLGGTQDVAFGFEYKRTNNDLSFGGTAVNQSFTEVNQFLITHTLSIPDNWGLTSLQSRLVYSPGNLTANNTDAAFQPGFGQSGTVGAHAKYFYVRGTVTRLVPLPDQFGATIRLNAQYSDQTLLPSEQLSIAGVDAVRGYQEGSITGSSGFTAAVELSGPKFSPSGQFGAEIGDSAQIHLFWDYGQGFNRTPSAAAPANLHTASLGVGGRYAVGDWLSMRLEQGWQLFRTRRQAAGGAFLHVSMSLTW